MSEDSSAPSGNAACGLRERLLAERSRWPLWLPVCLGLGIALYFELDFEPAPAIGPSLLALALALVVALRRRPALLALAAALFAAVLGFGAAQFATWRSTAPVLAKRVGPVVVEGRVLEVDLLPEGRRIVAEPRSIAKVGTAELPARIRIRLTKGGDPLAPGEWFRVRAILMPPPAPAMPGAYDFQRQAWFDRLGAVGFAVGAAARLEPPGGEGPAGWRLAVAKLRHAMTERIVAVLPGGTGGVAAALITGEMGPIPPDVNQAFRDSGLAHLLSISGIHMSLVAGIAFVALRALFALIPWLALRHPIKKWSAAIALVLVGAYTLLAGAPVPAQRSFLMIALIAFYEAFSGRLASWHEGRGVPAQVALYFVGIAITTVVATVATTPFAVYHFNRFALYALPANAAAVPITGFWVMPWAMVACLLMPFGLESWGLVPMGWGVDAIIAVAAGVSAWPGAVRLIPSMSEWGLLLVALGGLWVCIWRGTWRRWGVVPVCLGLATSWLADPPDVIVSGDAKLIAVKGRAGEYLLSSGKGGRIAEETWTRRAAADKGETWPEAGAAAGGMLSCDALGCLYRGNGRTVALVRRGEALQEDCGSADLVVSPIPVSAACRAAARVVDRIDVWRSGAHAVWLSPSGIRVESVDAARGRRPWVPAHPPAADRARPPRPRTGA